MWQEIQKISLVKNFQTVLDSNSFTDADGKNLSSGGEGEFNIGNITFPKLIESIEMEPSINRIEELNATKEIFKAYANAANPRFAGVLIRQEGGTRMRPHGNIQYFTYFNQNALRSLRGSFLEKIVVNLRCFVDEYRLGKWFSLDRVSTNYYFSVIVSKAERVLSDDQEIEISEKMKDEVEILDLILKGKSNLRLRFEFDMIGELHYHRPSLLRIPKLAPVVRPCSPELNLKENSILEALFENHRTKDVTIVLSGEVKIKVHKCILAVHSNVLEAMVTSKMKEGSSGIIRLDDISEAAMKQLVRYFYGIKIATLELNCETTCELFQAAHKYKLWQLEEGIAALVLQKNENWFTVDIALELYYCTKNIPDRKTMNEHLLKVLSRIPSNNIREAERFKELSTADVVDLSFQLNDVLRLQI